ncbi:hypothetical protein DdX_17597 [Ditylenchus destructor]|uniref:Uncharacterized protein n=1 Tax=Ditylenchus destructor TaxID=166010 RepID=A0AAD4MLF7_9BILA|nr:hypothetical protein DdX_17597 [Ditylenchus destructor]
MLSKTSTLVRKIDYKYDEMKPDSFKANWFGTDEIDVPGIGRCFYHVMSFYLTGSKKNHQAIRSDLAKNAHKYEYIYKGTKYGSSQGFVDQTRLGDEYGFCTDDDETYKTIVDHYRVHLLILRTGPKIMPYWTHFRPLVGNKVISEPSQKYPTLTIRLTTDSNKNPVHVRIIKNVFESDKVTTSDNFETCTMQINVLIITGPGQANIVQETFHFNPLNDDMEVFEELMKMRHPEMKGQARFIHFKKPILNGYINFADGTEVKRGMKLSEPPFTFACGAVETVYAVPDIQVN